MLKFLFLVTLGEVARDGSVSANAQGRHLCRALHDAACEMERPPGSLVAVEFMMTDLDPVDPRSAVWMLLRGGLHWAVQPLQVLMFVVVFLAGVCAGPAILGK